MANEFVVDVSDYRFACFLCDALAARGIKKTGACFLSNGSRRLYFDRLELPQSADFIPAEIPVNLPEVE